MFRWSTTEAEGPLSVSKWLQIQVILTLDEMKGLFDEIGDVFIVPVGCVIDQNRPAISKQEFLKAYELYVNPLIKGEEPDPRDYMNYFSCSLSKNEESFYAMQVAGSKMLIKPSLPVVQMQAHSMVYSIADAQIYPMVRGPESISWGIQFGFPTLYQNKRSYEPSNTLTDPAFINAALFQTIQKWMRRHTRPVPMMIHQKMLNLTVRIGNQCFSWINNHPHLRFHGLFVDNEGDEG